LVLLQVRKGGLLWIFSSSLFLRGWTPAGLELYLLLGLWRRAGLYLTRRWTDHEENQMMHYLLTIFHLLLDLALRQFDGKPLGLPAVGLRRATSPSFGEASSLEKEVQA
jgi:hypothetical protein